MALNPPCHFADKTSQGAGLWGVLSGARSLAWSGRSGPFGFQMFRCEPRATSPEQLFICFQLKVINLTLVFDHFEIVSLNWLPKKCVHIQLTHVDHRVLIESPFYAPTLCAWWLTKICRFFLFHRSHVNEIIVEVPWLLFCSFAFFDGIIRWRRQHLGSVYAAVAENKPPPHLSPRPPCQSKQWFIYETNRKSAAKVLLLKKSSCRI